jgi:hypothetical protein
VNTADLIDPVTVHKFITLIHKRAAAAIAGVTNARPSVLHLCSAAPSDTRFYTSAFNIGDTEQMIEAALINAAAGKNVFVEGRLVRPGRPTEGIMRGVHDATNSVGCPDMPNGLTGAPLNPDPHARGFKMPVYIAPETRRPVGEPAAMTPPHNPAPHPPTPAAQVQQANTYAKLRQR